MTGWVLALLLLKRHLSRDVTRLILRHVYPFRFETHWLKNERRVMQNEFVMHDHQKALMSQLMENTYSDTVGSIHGFLDQYRHEAGSLFIDMYDCPYYYGDYGDICRCGECGGPVTTSWCCYTVYRGKWMLNFVCMDDENKMSAVQISNQYYVQANTYADRIKRRREDLQERRWPIVKNPVRRK